MATISLPAYVSTVLITGAGGYVGREVATLLLSRYPDLNLVLTDIRAPLPLGSSTSVAADLSSPEDVAKLFSTAQIDAVGLRSLPPHRPEWNSSDFFYLLLF